MIGAGNLDRRLQFQRATLTDDGFSKVETFANHGDPVWAERRDVSDGEKARAGAVEAVLMTRFKVRWSPFSVDITAKDRMTCDGIIFDITGIKEAEGRRRWLEISGTARTETPS